MVVTHTRPRIGPADHGRAMTLEEFWDAEETPGYRYELDRGILVVVEVPGDCHRQIVWNLEKAFVRHDLAHPGLILCGGGGSEFRLAVPEMISERNPDAGIVLRGTTPDARGRRQPCLVVEVVSVGSEDRDYVKKRLDYAAFGILEYWIVDPQRRQVTVLTRRVGPDAQASWNECVFRGEDTIVSGVLTGFVGTVAELWVDAELADADG